MRIFLVFSIFLLTTDSFARKRKMDFLIKKESQLIVTGDASIMKFTCHLKGAFDLTPFAIKAVTKKNMNYLEEGKILVPIKNLDCGEKMRNNEMLELLKEKDYPYITLDFKELGVADWKKSEETGYFASNIYSKVDISIGGITVSYPVHLRVLKVNENNILASGSKKIRLNDFKIVPKTYFLGLVKIKELLDIDFELVLTKEGSNNINPPE